VVRIEDEMMFLLAMLNTYFKQFYTAFCMPFTLVTQVKPAQAAMQTVAPNAWQPLTPLPAPVLRLAL
jgi:hypothetical protein